MYLWFVPYIVWAVTNSTVTTHLFMATDQSIKGSVNSLTVLASLQVPFRDFTLTQRVSVDYIVNTLKYST